MGRRVESIPIGMPLSWALVVLISMANLAVAKGNPSQSSPTETIVSGGIERVFLLHVPEEIRGPAPLVIYLHGYTSDWREAGEYAEYDSLARKEGFFLVAPQGLGVVGINSCWNDGLIDAYWASRGLKCQAVDKNVDDVLFISDIIDGLIAQYGDKIDTSRIYATGLSSGGDMAYRLACELSSRIAAIAPVSPTRHPYSCIPDRPVP